MDKVSSEQNKTRAFDSADPAHGLRNFDPDILEPEQKEVLEQRKIDLKRDNEIYLNDHPEIRGLVSIILRLIQLSYKHKPMRIY